jgi:cell division protein FtsX
MLLLYTAWKQTRRHVLNSMENTVDRMKKNKYGMFLLLCLCTVKMLLFTVAILVVIGILWYLIMLVYTDDAGRGNETLEKAFCFLVEGTFYYGLCCAVIASFVTAMTIAGFWYNPYMNIEDEEYERYAEYHVLAHLDVMFLFLVVACLAWLQDQKSLENISVLPILKPRV